MFTVVDAMNEWQESIRQYRGVVDKIRQHHQTIFEKLPRKDIRIAGSGYLNSLNFLPCVHLRYTVTYFSAYSPWGLRSFCEQPGHFKDNRLHFSKRKVYFREEAANKSDLNWNRSAPQFQIMHTCCLNIAVRGLHINWFIIRHVNIDLCHRQCTH